MHPIELHGSFTAATTYGGEEIEITKKNKSPVPPLCRALIDRGADPRGTARITRRGMPVWKKHRTLGDWAAINIFDDDNRGGVRIKPHRPFPKS